MKGKDHVELIAEQPKEANKDAKVNSKAPGIKPPAVVKSKANETTSEKPEKSEELKEEKKDSKLVRPTPRKDTVKKPEES